MQSRGILLSLLSIAPAVRPLAAQTVDDAQFFPRRAVAAGFVYTHDAWTEYWEGTLKRDNGNIGTVSTQSVTWVAGFGVTDRLSVFASLPYVWTHASAGPLHGMAGLQDFVLAAKYQLLTTPFTNRGTLRAIVAGAACLPASNYTPDFLPLSIGLDSRWFSGRFTLNFQANGGWFLNGSTAYTWRSNVRLDRPAYFTNGQLYLTDEVAMPTVFDYTLTAGYSHGRLTVPISLSQQRTLGGADMRRQDMPFVSNRMDFVRVGGTVQYTLPRPAVDLRVGVSRVLSGRNVGQSTTLSVGLFHTFLF